MDIIGGSILVAAIINLFAGSIIFFYGKGSRVNASFAVFVFGIFLWAMARFFIYIDPDTTLWWKIAYAAPLFIVSGFFTFSTLFLVQAKEYWKNIAHLFYVIASICAIAIWIIAPIDYGDINSYWWVFIGYSLFVVAGFTLSYIVLISSFLQAKGSGRYQLLLVIIGTLVPVILTFYTNAYLPTTGQESFTWMGPVSTLVMVFAVLYAMAKYNFLHARLLTIQAIVLSINLVMFLQALNVKSGREFALKILIFLLVFFLLQMLLRSVRKEISQREELEELSKKLSRANKELQKLDSAKSEFISIASHQLRTPLTAIRGYASLIGEGAYGPMTEEVGTAVKKISNASDRLAQLMEDLLNISRIESGRMEFKFDTVNISKIVQNLYDTFVLRTESEHLDFKITVNADTGAWVNADPSKIQEVISNLIDNAIKYTEKGFVHVGVDVIGDLVQVAVSDSGIGIPKEVLPQLFEKFSRGEDQSRLHVDGTGLGLFVGRNIVQAHNGRILVDSEGKGKGSTFTLELPRVDAPEEEK